MDLIQILSDGIDLSLWFGIALAASVIVAAVVATVAMLIIQQGVKLIRNQITKKDIKNGLYDDYEEVSEGKHVRELVG